MFKMISIVAILISLSLLSGCSNQKEKTSTPSTAPSTAPSKTPTMTPTITPSTTSSPVSQTGSLPTENAKVFTEINGRVSAGIIFDDNNSMYIAKDKELLKVSPDGTVSVFCSFKDLEKGKDYYFSSPLIWDMIFDKQGNILAAAQDRILKITPDGKVSTLIREDFGGFLGASGIESDDQGNLYITNGSKIEKYTPDLKKTTFIDALANGYRGFFSLKFDPEGKNLYASDFYSKSLLKYEIDENGNASESPTVIVSEPIENSGDYGSPLNIIFSNKGTLYCSIDGMGKLMRVDSNGTIDYLELGEEEVQNHYIAFGGNGFKEDSIYITTFNGKNIYEYKIGE